MVKYSDFRDELQWYESSDSQITEVNMLLAGDREDFDNILEQVEQKFPQLTRVQELIGQASFVDRETRMYKSENGGSARIAIYNIEDTKSKIIVAHRIGYSGMIGTRFFDVYPTTDAEKKLENEVLWSDEDWEQVK